MRRTGTTTRQIEYLVKYMLYHDKPYGIYVVRTFQQGRNIQGIIFNTINQLGLTYTPRDAAVAFGRYVIRIALPHELDLLTTGYRDIPIMVDHYVLETLNHHEEILLITLNHYEKIMP